VNCHYGEARAQWEVTKIKNAALAGPRSGNESGFHVKHRLTEMTGGQEGDMDERCLNRTDYALLAALSEDRGRKTGHVSSLAFIGFCGNRRQRSGAVRAWLVRLQKEGYVTTLDDQKPVCWLRTEKGTQALGAAKMVA
jgi:hypothetical protein